ncbi:MAG: bifunctional adenosylcobinamide kinase/adenosylcobinamide-phosphate guanylyltransferase [Anaerolineales bacterium]|nr:bifunctional adenosylcobinamide kinase/adenosylcobinamide-phosphate guanylyltransferase [Anaerolineales bacterium]
MSNLTLILGGARSGKSDYAESLARETNQPVLFIATATVSDDEMRERIEHHRAARPQEWQTLEAPMNIAAELESKISQLWNGVILLDCVTLLVSNILLSLPEDSSFETVMQKVKDEIDALIAAQERIGGEWIVVSNEVGLGLVPPYPLGRIYRDALGRANQMLARAAGHVTFMVAGIPTAIK